jgi:hypothetical protein
MVSVKTMEKRRRDGVLLKKKRVGEKNKKKTQLTGTGKKYEFYVLPTKNYYFFQF